AHHALEAPRGDLRRPRHVRHQAPDGRGHDPPPGHRGPPRAGPTFSRPGPGPGPGADAGCRLRDRALLAGGDRGGRDRLRLAHEDPDQPPVLPAAHDADGMVRADGGAGRPSRALREHLPAHGVPPGRRHAAAASGRPHQRGRRRAVRGGNGRRPAVQPVARRGAARLHELPLRRRADRDRHPPRHGREPGQATRPRLSASVASSNRRARAGYWFVAPATLVLLLVLVVPVVHVLYESFVWTTSSRVRIVPSVRNYAALAEDEIVRTAASNTVTFTVVSVLGHLALGLGVALLLNQEIRGRAAFRNLALLPCMLPPAV